MAATLILLNGVPGVGKSTVAARYVAEHPDTELIEIDTIRTGIPGWRDDDRSKQVAREVALKQIAMHLRAGRNVILPQFLGKLEFIESLASVARSCDADFREIILTARPDEIARRFRER